MSPFPLYVSCLVHLVALSVLLFIDIHGLYGLSLFPVTIMNCVLFLLLELSQAGGQCPWKRTPVPSHFYPRPLGVVIGCHATWCCRPILIFPAPKQKSAPLQGALLRFNPSLGAKMWMCWWQVDVCVGHFSDRPGNSRPTSFYCAWLYCALCPDALGFLLSGPGPVT